ncbi:hypothetical protein H1V43_38995 [Streptomyces sp. PSKA54]|uniref:Uncharacterized protein n=1 Tax=Streptomyces himalayensis subsp. aureolus TaxID=2758039 RepID=A0A7W2D9E4_9ACTN|nr:hypothetical protein [Streptomyces himalayensis]MBA4867168.1 hypothetical protein [Streptomyces himalayensis subsp. aureolus]
MPWCAEQERRLQARPPGYHAYGITGGAPQIIDRLVPGLGPVHRRLYWTRRVPLDVHLAHLGSRSYFAALGPEESAPVLADERRHLVRYCPDGLVEEAYAVDFTVVRRPGHRAGHR